MIEVMFYSWQAGLLIIGLLVATFLIWLGVGK